MTACSFVENFLFCCSRRWRTCSWPWCVCAERRRQGHLTDLNNLQGDVIGKVNCSAQTFVLDADQTEGFAEFAGQWMTAKAFGEKWVEETGDSYGSELAMQVAEAAMGEACAPE